MDIHEISKKSKQTSVSLIKEMHIKSLSFNNVVSLCWGVPSFKTPKPILDKIATELFENKDINKYTDIRGLLELKEKIAFKLKVNDNISINPEKEILITVGAQQAVMSALQTIINSKDEVILIAPYFSSHYDQIIFANGKPVIIDLNFDNKWKFEISLLERAITKKTRAIIITNPSNPTGKIYTKKELLSIADLAIKHNFYIITDETYNFLNYTNNKIYNLLSYQKIRNNLISCYSFSKEYSLSGWRIGYICSNNIIISEILKFHDACVIVAPHISQIAAITAISKADNFVKQFITQYEIRLKLTINHLHNLSDFFEFIKPNGSYYIFLRFKNENINGKKFANDLLEKHQVLVVPGETFGKSFSNFIRISFSANEKVINEAFKRISIYLKTIQK